MLSGFKVLISTTSADYLEIGYGNHQQRPLSVILCGFRAKPHIIAEGSPRSGWSGVEGPCFDVCCHVDAIVACALGRLAR